MWTNAPGACRRTTGGDSGNVIDRADLVVHGHYTHDCDIAPCGAVLVEKISERVHINPCETVDRNDVAAYRLDDMQHGVVFGGPHTPPLHRCG